MIEVKAFYSGWHEATEEQARALVKHLYSGMTGRCDKEARINTEHLRGTTFKELTEEHNEDGKGHSI